LLFYIFRNPIVTFSWAVGTSTTSVSFVLLQETTKLSSSKDDIKIDAFLITDIIFQEGIISMYCSFASSVVR
jgi:hypothetical protein